MKRPMRANFSSLSMWLKALTEYALSTSHPSAGLRHALRDIPTDIDSKEERLLIDVHGMFPKCCSCWARISIVLTVSQL